MDPKVKDEIQDMINHVDGVGLQKTWKNIQDVLSKHNLVSTLVIPCDQIGVRRWGTTRARFVPGALR